MCCLKIKSSNVICYTLPQEHGVVYKPQSNQATEMFGTSKNCSKLDLGLTSITRLGFFTWIPRAVCWWQYHIFACSTPWLTLDPSDTVEERRSEDSHVYTCRSGWSRRPLLGVNWPLAGWVIGLFRWCNREGTRRHVGTRRRVIFPTTRGAKQLNAAPRRSLPLPYLRLRYGKF